MRYSDEELLKLVADERRRSIGFGEGDSGELTKDRERALRFYQGDISQDVPSMDNRSSAVSTDVAEAVETALPDLVEIFIGGDDIATFQAQNAEDEKQAQQESDYVRHVIFSDNDGFLAFNTAFKDALLVKTGLFHWWWEEEEDEETSPWMAPEELAVALQQEGAPDDIEVEENDDGTVRAKRQILKPKVCIRAVPPEDFTIARDATDLRGATYCAMRDRPRVQDLIARGVDEEVARELKSYTQPDQTISEARDEAGEQTLLGSEGTGDLRVVEVRSHYLRLLEDDGEMCIWRIDTDSEETVLISKEEVPSIPFGAITPYMNPHRFYGESVADKLIEIQKIKTTLWRMQLDDGYFALNQRMAVDVNLANEFTIPDLLNNVPNMPVRVNGQGAVTAIRAGGLNFDVLSAMEQASVMGEQRSGIVRNAQGLKPDTMHDTARGAIALITAAQKRLRHIARIFAETGVKDLFRGVHELLRQGYGQKPEGGKARAKPHAKLRKEWTTIDPAQWPERTAVEVGIGSAGREHDMAVMREVMQTQAEMLGVGLGGVIVKPENIHAAAIRFGEVADLKSPERFFSDPAQQPPQPPKPDPEMEKAKAQLQIEQGKAQANMQLEQAKAQTSAQLERDKHEASLQAEAMKAQNDHALSMAKLEAEMQLKREQIAAELQLKREQLTAELQLKRELGLAQAAVAHETGMAKVNASTSTVEPGGEPG